MTWGGRGRLAAESIPLASWASMADGMPACWHAGMLAAAAAAHAAAAPAAAHAAAPAAAHAEHAALSAPRCARCAAQDKGFAFVEFRSVEEASNCMALDGLAYNEFNLKVRFGGGGGAGLRG